MVKNLLASAADARDTGSIPGMGRSPGVGNGNPLQYFAGESHRQRSLVGYSPGVTKTWTQLSGLCRRTHVTGTPYHVSFRCTS